MKTAVFFTLVFLISSSLNAQNPQHGYIGLFLDDSHNLWCTPGISHDEAEVWVWCLPSERGMICIDSEEFRIVTDYYTMVLNTTSNPDLDSGASQYCFKDCQMDWNWIFHQTMCISSPKVVVKIVPHIDDVICFLTCDEGNPPEPVTIYTNAYINYDPTSAECLTASVVSTSWGAIKSLF